MGFEEFEEWFEENGMESVAQLLKIQQQGAIDLTKLVLEHCKSYKITKDYVFKVYQESLNLIKSELNEDF